MKNFIVESKSYLPVSWLLLEDSWETFSASHLPGYFKDGYEIFQRRLSEFNSLRRPLTLQEEHNLEFMLSSLIHAKNVMYKRE